MLVSQVLSTKGDRVFTAHLQETVEAAAAKLWTRRIGALVVMDDRDQVVGIVSERDIVGVVAQSGGHDLHRPVSEVMTREVLVASPSEQVEVVLERMTDRRVRHFPVCDGGHLVGIVSIGDLVKSKIAETEAEAQHLRAYIAS